MNTAPDPNPIITALRQALPTTFSRQVAARHLAGIYTVSTLANIDSRKEGPPMERIGRCVIYERDTFLDWLESRFKTKRPMSDMCRQRARRDT